jgi:hypothetical protein
MKCKEAGKRKTAAYLAGLRKNGFPGIAACATVCWRCNEKQMLDGVCRECGAVDRKSDERT